MLSKLVFLPSSLCKSRLFHAMENKVDSLPIWMALRQFTHSFATSAALRLLIRRLLEIWLLISVTLFHECVIFGYCFAVLGDHEFFGRLVERFEAKCDKIPCWGPRGQVYADYHHMKEGIHQISDESHVRSIFIFSISGSIQGTLFTLCDKWRFIRTCGVLLLTENTFVHC